MDIKESSFKVIIKPNSKVNSIESFDSVRNAYVVRIKARPENNKANMELVKFLSKSLKKKAHIVPGFKSREKLISTNKY